jgi:tetratricopeptide (TPR) repeat protein
MPDRVPNAAHRLSLSRKATGLARAVVFRIAALLLGLAPLGFVELVLAELQVGQPELSDDPFVGFSAVRPLFVLNDDGTRYETAPSRLKHFVPDSFAAAKDVREYRTFVLGGSTVQGNPYSVPTSFTTWLELSLRAAQPSQHWKVVNCGGISYATYRLVPIMQELLAYEPDLFIVYEGHNEFLEDRTYARVKHTAPFVGAAHEQLARLHTYNLLRTGYLRLVGNAAHSTAAVGKTMLDAEVEALLDYRGGMECYHRDEVWRAGVIAHYDFNVRRMVEIARRAGVQLILMNPVCNLRDSPPFKSEHRAGLNSAELANWESLWSEARQCYDGRHPRAVSLLEQAIAIDDQHAGIHYDLAKCAEALGRIEQASDEYMLAKELDVCPLRVLEPMNQSVLDIARQTGTPVVDARRIFEELSPHGIPGHEWLVDHVHPSIRGHQVLADALAEEMVRLGIVRPDATWKESRDHVYAEHLRSLDTIYYFRAQQHLEGLTRWAEGRITKERPSSHPAPDPVVQ